MKRHKAICIPQNPLLECALCHFMPVEVVDKILVAAMMRKSATTFNEAAISFHSCKQYK